MMKLTAADKKIWNRVCDSPYWEDNFRPSLQERLLERLTIARNNCDEGQHIHLRSVFPNLSDELLRDMAYDLGRFIDQQDLRIGIARRVWLDDPTELTRFLSYSARSHWLREGYSFGHTSIPSTYVLEAIAAGDWAFVHRTLDSCSFPLRQGGKWRRIGAFSPEGPAESDALLGILLGHLDDAEKALIWLESLKSTEAEKADRECLWGLLQNDSQRFLAGLGAVREATRKVRGTTLPEYRLISLQLHGYFELALQRNPAWVVRWDVEQGLPWDAGFYHWRRTGKPALREEDLAGLEPDFISHILNLPSPKWWSSLQSLPV